VVVDFPLERVNCRSPPCGTRERDRLQTRRLRAAQLFAAGLRQAEVARQLGVSAQAVSVWHARWQDGGAEALRSRGPSGPAPRLSDAQLATVEQALLEGAGANGFVGELCTLDRTTVVIQLRKRGHDVVAPDLPSEDDSAGLGEYADTVAEAIGDRTDLAVVAQSFGGFLATSSQDAR
jgi:transposase